MNETDTRPVRLIDIRTSTGRRGCKRAKFYDDIRQGLMCPPIRIGPRFARWPEHEVDAVVRARISGADDAAIRTLVDELLAQRREVAADA